MKHCTPFDWLPVNQQPRAFLVLLPITLVVMAIEQITGAPLRTDAAPSGIVSFELAGTFSLAQAMVKSWGQLGQVYAGLNLGFDFVFIPAYVLCIGLGCVLVARGGFLPAVGVTLAWALFAAGIFDGIENYNLIQILLGFGQEANAMLAQWCAVPKFAIIGVALAYFFIGGAAALLNKARATVPG